MGTVLARIVVRFPWAVLAFWAVAAAIALPRAWRVNDVLQVEASSESLTEAKYAAQVVQAEFPTPVSEFLAVTVTGPDAYGSPRFNGLLTALVDSTTALDWVTRVVSFPGTGDSALISDDGRTTFFLAALDVRDSILPVDRVPLFRELIHRVQDDQPGGRLYHVNVTGGPALGYDARTVAAADARHGEERALPLTAIILVLAFGALVAAVLPIIIGVLAIDIALALVHFTAGFQPMSVFVLNIVTMVGLAVGIDYSLLMVTRFREEMNRGFGRREAAERTIASAGRAVITSGLTVAVGFSSLLVTPIVDTRSVGIGGMFVVTVAVLLSVTLLPAGLTLLGRRIDMPRALARKLAWYHAPSRWERWARMLARHPWRAIALGSVLIGIFTWPLVNIRIGLPAQGWFPSGTESAAGVEALEALGARGSLQPVRLVIQAPAGERVLSSRYLRGLRRLSDTLSANPRVAQVRGPVDLRERMSIFSYSILYSDMERAREQYPEFMDSYVSRDSRTTIMDLLLADTTSFTGSMDLVRDVRGIVRNGVSGLDSVSILVGGFAASSVDLQSQLLSQFPLVIALVVVITAIMLLIAFQSILVPIKAVVMNCLSVAGAFGLTVLVFQEGVGAGIFGLSGPTEAVYVAVPILVFAVVFGLSMDYEVFLLARIKEAYRRTRDNDKATMEGLSATASVITSAALVMIIVFGVSSFSRVLAAQLMGFGLAVAVFLDATIIRMILVPAIMHIAGGWNWWPGMKPSERAEPPAQA